MQLVVCDTTTLFPALVDADGLYRKLLVVFAWGKLHHDLRALQDEQAEAERFLAANPGAEIGGNWDGERVEVIRDRIARLEEHLPVMTPKDYGLVISPPIAKELADNMAGRSSELGNQPPEAIEQFVWAAAESAAVYVIHGFDGSIPPYTEGRDEKDDPIIHTAVLARAEWILSQDKKHIALTHKRPTEYVDPESGRVHLAVRLSFFLSKVICSGYHFDEDNLREIDGSLLNIAIGQR